MLLAEQVKKLTFSGYKLVLTAQFTQSLASKCSWATADMRDFVAVEVVYNAVYAWF
jgi:hypothetical protein